jgi:hypothetical protein
MLFLKIIALLASLIVLVIGALKIRTEIGIWGFLGIIISLIWLLVE